MTHIQKILAVFRFECTRSLTLPRLAWIGCLALFPAFIVFFIITAEAAIESRNEPSTGITYETVTEHSADTTVETDAEPFTEETLIRWGIILFFLIPNVVCLMGLLLWATPVVHSELEGRTWVYLAVRPGGKVSMLFGKYLAAVSWTVLAAVIGLALSLAIARPPESLRLFFIFLALAALASLTYGAAYTLIGVILHRRAMVAAVAYTLVEMLVGFVPAVINKFTVQFRLRSLLVEWLVDPKLTKEMPGVFAPLLDVTSQPVVHVLILLIYTAVLLGASMLILMNREYIKAEQE